MTFTTFVRRWRLTVPAALVVSGALVWGLRSVPPVDAAAPPTGPAPVGAVAGPLNTLSYADAVERAMPAVVTVQVAKRAQPMPAMGLPDDPFFQRFFGPFSEGDPSPAPLQEGLGSGVIMTPDGTILTNHHVIEDAEQVQVTLSDGRQFEARVAGSDPPTDLAVLKIDGDHLPTVPVADSDRVRVGDVVLALGNPLGIGQTVTMGIISATGRTTALADDTSYQDFLQTDAPINRGNSGGALITTSGELVGINSQIVSPSGGSIGIGFAIPSNMARHVMAELVEQGRVRRGLLGVTVQTVTSDLAKSLELDAVRGAIVSSVNEDSPAEAAGLRPGDVILSVNGVDVADSNDLRNRISANAPGTAITLGVVRNGRPQQLTATLDEVPTAEPATSQTAAEHGELGMALEPITPSRARQLDLPRDAAGVVVTGVDPAGAAARAGIRQGDVIREVNGREMHAPADVGQAVGASGDRPALVRLERNGQPLFLALPVR